LKKKEVDDFLPLLKLENHLEERKWMEYWLPLKNSRSKKRKKKKY
jgi:hypothetical protein